MAGMTSTSVYSWSTKALREMLSCDGKVERQPCYICGMHQPITELHHVIPVSELTRMLNDGLVELQNVSTPIVWLCPNCHRYVHAVDDLPQDGDEFNGLIASLFSGTKHESKSWEVANRFERLIEWRFEAEADLLGVNDEPKR